MIFWAAQWVLRATLWLWVDCVSLCWNVDQSPIYFSTKTFFVYTGISINDPLATSQPLWSIFHFIVCSLLIAVFKLCCLTGLCALSRLINQRLMEEQSQVEELQKSLQEQGSKADDVSNEMRVLYFVHFNSNSHQKRPWWRQPTRKMQYTSTCNYILKTFVTIFQGSDVFFKLSLCKSKMSFTHHYIGLCVYTLVLCKENKTVRIPSDFLIVTNSFWH